MEVKTKENLATPTDFGGCLSELSIAQHLESKKNIKKGRNLPVFVGHINGNNFGDLNLCDVSSMVWCECSRICGWAVAQLQSTNGLNARS